MSEAVLQLTGEAWSGGGETRAEQPWGSAVFFQMYVAGSCVDLTHVVQVEVSVVFAAGLRQTGSNLALDNCP
jgi:hypothetical protein